MALGAPAMGYEMVKAARALAREFPEDFVARVRLGLDEPTVRGLEKGVRALAVVHRSDRLALRALLLGIGALLIGAIAAFVSDRDDLFLGALVLSAASWVGALVFAAIPLRVVMRSGEDVHRVIAFHSAMARASISRDFA